MSVKLEEIQRIVEALRAIHFPNTVTISGWMSDEEAEKPTIYTSGWLPSGQFRDIEVEGWAPDDRYRLFFEEENLRLVDHDGIYSDLAHLLKSGELKVLPDPN